MSEESIIAALTSGSLNIQELGEATKLTKATLHRQIKPLIAANRISVLGKGRATRYALTTAVSALVSKEAQDLRQQLQMPSNARIPAGYHANFLLSYGPQTPFLDETTRAHLAVVGRRGTPAQPPGTYARKVLDRLLIDLSWNSSRLEGNTYSLLETERLLTSLESAEGRDARETQMILNHKAAIEFLVDQAEELACNTFTLKSLHAILSENLLADPSAGGALRNTSVAIGGSVFHPLDDPHRVREYFEILVQKASAVADPFEQAFFLLVQIPYLQPFIDVNKRVSRLAANIPFIRNNISPLSFVEVGQDDYVFGVLGVYERNDVSILRDVFVWAYERSAARYAAIMESMGEPDEFRLQMRTHIKEAVAHVIQEAMDRAAASMFLEEFSQNLPAASRSRFQQVCVEELNALHEGNFARYRVRPSEFDVWQRKWLA